MKYRQRRNISRDVEINRVLFRAPLAHDALAEFRSAPGDGGHFDLGKFFLKRFAKHRLESAGDVERQRAFVFRRFDSLFHSACQVAFVSAALLQLGNEPAKHNSSAKTNARMARIGFGIDTPSGQEML